eukprot:scaffold132867_cov36-Phaeocystis_antarctica.AAC.2
METAMPEVEQARTYCSKYVRKFVAGGSGSKGGRSKRPRYRGAVYRGSRSSPTNYPLTTLTGGPVRRCRARRLP